MNFILTVVRLVVLAAFTFAFVVLFEHGPKNFLEGAKSEWHFLLEGKNDAGSSASDSLKSGA